eukprot:352245-Chlamydomonas_euryale.AAC.1
MAGQSVTPNRPVRPARQATQSQSGEVAGVCQPERPHAHTRPHARKCQHTYTRTTCLGFTPGQRSGPPMHIPHACMYVYEPNRSYGGKC